MKVQDMNVTDVITRRQQSGVKHQENIHEGVKHECDRCNYKATTKDNLIAHLKGIHEGVRYKCD